MFKNYFLIATRNLAKHKLFTIINVFGLAIGMSISLLLISMLSFINTYDNFHTNKDRIFRVITQVDDKQSNDELASAPAALGEKLREEFSGIEEVVRIHSSLNAEAKYLEKKTSLHGYFVDPGFLKVFSFPLINGSLDEALDKPNTIVITDQAAKKIFGSTDPIGKVLEMGEFGDFEITGVLKNIPKNSHMSFEVLGSYKTLESKQGNSETEVTESWKIFSSSYVYLLLPEKQDISRVRGYLKAVSKHIYSGESNFSGSFELQALNDIVPGKSLMDSIGPEWDFTSLSVFMVLTLLILLPACFNYANISISLALKRMKEIGLRKVMGGQSHQIFYQFILETVIITMAGLLISYYIFDLIRAEFLSLLVSADALDLDPTRGTILYFILFGLFVGLAAGFVPALYFSRLTPIQALKAKPVKKGFSGFTLRKVLIISQFTLSLVFIMSVVIVLNQYRYVMNFDFGFQQENLLDVKIQSVNQQVLKNEFERISEVQQISMSSHILGTESMEQQWVKNTQKSDSVEAFEMAIDGNYLTNLNLLLLAGRNFENDSGSKNMIIVNEEFLKIFNILAPVDAIDQSFILWDGSEVIVGGVVKNFHYMSLREPIRSFFFRYDPSLFRYANVKMASYDISHDLAQMEQSWSGFGGEEKFEAKFFDDEIREAYDMYFTLIKTCSFLGLLAITISCLGLLGMVVFTIENRIKEVGVRKVMGASSLGLTVLLSKDFLKLMIIAAIIATPMTYAFFANYYQSIQYYSTKIGIIEIVVSIVILLFLGLTTILSQTLKAARANPVDTLRYE